MQISVNTIKTGVPVIYDYTHNDNTTGYTIWFWLGEPSISTWIEVPIINDSGCMGIIFLVPAININSSLEELKSNIYNLASLYGAKINDIKQHEELNVLRLVEDSQIILEHDIINLLGGYANNIENPRRTLFQTISDSIINISRPDWCAIYLDSGQEYRMQVQSGGLKLANYTSITNHYYTNSIIHNAVLSHNNIYIIGKRKDCLFEYLKKCVDSTESGNLLNNIRTWGASPIVIGSEVQGAIIVASSDWDYFQPWQKKSLNIFAQKAALVITVENIVKGNFENAIEQTKIAGNYTQASRTHDTQFKECNSKVWRNI